MATTPDPNPQNPQNIRAEEQQELREQVRLLDQQALSWKNILSLKIQAKKASKDEKDLRAAIIGLGREEARNAIKYKDATQAIKDIEKDLKEAKLQGNRVAIRDLEKELRLEKDKQTQLRKTAGGAIQSQALEARKRKESLQAERQLIKDINKERGIGGKLADLFRTKEQRQRQIDIARAKAGGGANIPPTAAAGAGGAGGAGGGGGAKVAGALAGAGVIGLIIAGITAAVEKIKAPLQALGGLVKTNLTAPLAQASNLVNGGIGGGYGVGGGAIGGGGATSILGGLQDVASKIPFIGGLLGGLVGIFKSIVDLVLGLDQGVTNFARNLGISKDRAKAIKEEFRGIAKASDSIVVNETRLMESQAELTKALGVRSQFSADILENNIKLKEIAGLELETRKALVQTSVIQGRNATQLTKNILSQTKAFEFQTGVAFEFRDVLSQASKQAGVLGLIFANNDKKLTGMLLRTKAMGFELKQLDGLASSFLDFESSISKEMEAQVLTGREMNLTAAREAALNNDLVGLAKEINQNVGSTADYLNMNRIQQDAIAESVGMTRDSLADVLKQQDYYRKLGATNLKQAQEELRILKQRGLTQAEISAKIGEDAYNYITQTSTAERLTELMNKIKTTFIEFVEKSGILDFITNPDKIQGFVTGLINRLAGAVNMIGEIIAGTLEIVGDVVGIFSSEKGARFKGLASQVRTGAGQFAGSMTAVAGTLAPSITGAVESGAKTEAQKATSAPTSVPSPYKTVPAGQSTGDVYLDGQKVGLVYQRASTQVPGQAFN